MDYDNPIPWKVQPRHRHMYAAKMLRTHAKLQKGEDVSPTLRMQYSRWMIDLQEKNEVIGYDPTSDHGFLRFTRREGIDTGLFREEG